MRALFERLGLVDPLCAEVYFTQLDFGNVLCFKLLLAKLLSIAVIAGASIVKVPQILNIWKRGAKGLSFISLVLEILGYVIVISHAIQSEFSLDAYAESFFVLFQNIIIMFLIVREDTGTGKIALTGLVLALLGECGRRAYGFVNVGSLILEKSVMESVRSAATVIFTMSRIPQIYSNFSNQSTGSLSLITLLLQFFGGAARVFTTLVNKKNYSPAVFYGFLISVILSFVIICQIFWYKDRQTATAKQEKKSREPVQSKGKLKAKAQ